MNEREVEAVARALLNARMPKHEANWERVADSARLAYSNDARAAITALDAARGDGWQMTEPPTDTLILAVVPYNVQHGNGPKIAMTERYVCKIDDAGDLLTEGGDDIGWRGEDITAWRECPALPGDGE
jgi:hypothetical protein